MLIWGDEMISVIIPVYNKERYISRVVDMLKRQTYKNIEIIFIDDGSTDNSYNIAKLYEDGKKIFVYRQKNQGVSAARNKGMTYANGEWLSFLDPDDLIAENYFEDLISVAADYDIISCCCYAVGDNGKKINNFFLNSMSFYGDQKKILFYQLLDDTYGQPGKTYTAIGVPWGKLYKKSLVLSNNLKFDIKLKKQEDNIFNMYAFKYAKRIFYLNKPLYFYSLEHIKNDYVSNYDSYAVRNVIELQKERMTFFTENCALLDKSGEDFLNNATISSLVSSFNKCLLNKANTQTYFEKRNEYLYIIRLPFFAKIIRNLDILRINGFVHKIVALSMKCSLFYPINFIWHFRSIYVKIKYKNHKK